jgi:bacterioferritin-associated ferredoxin
MKIVCRCEDITEQEVLQAIQEGFTDIEELRKKLRIGMGACQGRVCFQLLIKILNERGKIPRLPKSRPPLIPVPLGVLAGREDEE